MPTGTAARARSPSGSLYQRDLYTWAMEQSCALKERRAAALDWDNLAEEVGDLAARHADSLKSYCQVLVEHLLKLVYAPGPIRKNNRRLWTNRARNARIRSRNYWNQNPGLKNRAPDLFAKAWVLGRNDALGKLDLEDDLVAQICPWTFEQAMDEIFRSKTHESSRSIPKSKTRRGVRQ